MMKNEILINNEPISLKLGPTVLEIPGIIDSYNIDISIASAVKTKGKLFMSSECFYFNDESGKTFYKSPVEKFYHWELESEKNEYEIHLNSKGFPIRLGKGSNSINLGELDKQQANCVKRACDIINEENSENYTKKVAVENRIIEAIIEGHYNELENFIINNSNDILLLYNSLHIVYNHLEENYFNRHVDDLPWGRKLLVYEYPNSDFKVADDLIEQFDLLANYLRPLIDQSNQENACISYHYIVWQAMISVALDYYTKEFSNNHNGDLCSIKDIAAELTSEGNCTNFEFMQGVYYATNKQLSTSKFFEVYNELLDEYTVAINNAKQNAFNQSLTKKNIQKSITIDDIDMMTGVEFEDFLKECFEKLGYSASATKASGDQGIDLLLEKNGTKIGVQAKCYSGSVGNSAVQEAVAGKKFYHCDKVMVITNSYFTDSAIELAKVNDVVLWDRNILKEKL